MEILKGSHIPVTVIVGPGFEHLENLQQVIPDHFVLRVNVPSLAETFSEFDLAFTAGGVTPFEACASGLPCVVIATEMFEVPIGEYLEKMGAALYAGYYKTIKKIDINILNIQTMSKQAMLCVDTKGANRVYEAVMTL